jgi:CubicO group peptidase (beta-lactamase class C family)
MATASDKLQAVIKFKADVFNAAIEQEYEGGVMGYSFVIANEAGIQAKVSGGWAQAPGDGNVPMKTHVASCIGSVSKVLSAIALLHLFDRHQLEDTTVQAQLDREIWPQLPAKWRDAFGGGNLEQITYRHLLQHKCFRISDTVAKANTTGTKMSYVLSQGISLANLQERAYNNFNISILLFIIPAIAFPEAVVNIHRKFRHLGIDEYSQAITPEYGALYGKYMHEVIFPKAIEPIAPTCRPSHDLAPDKYAKEYASVSAAQGGVINADFCRAQGAWYVTAQDLATFARTFAFTNRYIGPATRASLYDPTDEESRDQRIVYSRELAHVGFGNELGQRFWAYHGGDQPDYYAALIKLPFDHYGVGMVNSAGRGEGDDIARDVLNAFFAATRD